MFPATRNVLRALLKDRYFSVGLDLGSGEGLYGPLLKQHVGYLIAIDRNSGRLRFARWRRYYDELVVSEIQNYQIPSGTEAAFLLDSLEHLPKKEGYDLLRRLSSVPFIVISTPKMFHELSFRNRHQSYWTEQEFQALGFATMTHDLGLIGTLLGSRKAILAVKGL